MNAIREHYSMNNSQYTRGPTRDSDNNNNNNKNIIIGYQAKILMLTQETIGPSRFYDE